jgi:hypothetical protein
VDNAEAGAENAGDVLREVESVREAADSDTDAETAMEEAVEDVPEAGEALEETTETEQDEAAKEDGA